MFSAVRRITAMSGGRVRAAFAASTAAAQRAVLSQQRTVFCLKQQRWCGGVGAGQGAAPRTHESLEELDAEYTDKAVEMLDEVGKVINEAWDKEIREPAILFKVIQAMDLYSKAMDRGSARAANDLAVIYHTGRCEAQSNIVATTDLPSTANPSQRGIAAGSCRYQPAPPPPRPRTHTHTHTHTHIHTHSPIHTYIRTRVPQIANP